MTIQAKIIEDSISTAGKRITTFQLMYPRFIHAELMTHRVFSRNASSSRAIPVSKMLEMVRDDPAMPIHWGRNQPGMQAKEELLLGDRMHAKQLWHEAAIKASFIAEKMMEVGLHKQVANRILEPFQHISVVLTATEFDNWFELRAHEDAQPEIQYLAREMQLIMAGSTPKALAPNEWHLPYITDDDRTNIVTFLKQGRITRDEPRQSEINEMLCRISAARCCRVSYLKHDGTTAAIDEDLALCEKLVGAKPLHASPFEHQATPDTRLEFEPGVPIRDWNHPELHGNFTGWIQYRKQIEHLFK
jgi:thymidylate synthase ThyX